MLKLLTEIWTLLNLCYIWIYEIQIKVFSAITSCEFSWFIFMSGFNCALEIVQLKLFTGRSFCGLSLRWQAGFHPHFNCVPNINGGFGFFIDTLLHISCYFHIAAHPSGCVAWLNCPCNKMDKCSHWLGPIARGEEAKSSYCSVPFSA